MFYPTAWRYRYEREFLDLLQERPMRLRDSVDVIRGAVDAHVHPQHVGPSWRESIPWTNRLPGLLAMAAGLMWSGTFLYLSVGRNWYAEWGGLIPMSLILMIISLPGEYMLAALAAVRAEMGRGARWVLIAGAVGIPGAIAIPISFGLVGTLTEPWPTVALLLPWGLAWVVVGLRMAIRGAPTIVDPPIHQTDREVQAA